MKKISLIAITSLGVLAGCANVVSTNGTARVPVPSIASTDSLADIEIKELVKGQGCVTKTLGIISSGDTSFLDSSGTPSFTAIERAKSAATFNALSKDGLSTDILVNPVWEIHSSDSFFVNDICARVVGYRGVIKGFKQMQTLTRGPDYKAPNEAPVEKRATNSHFVRESDETEREVIVHEESRSSPPHESPKEAKGDHSDHGEPKHLEPKHEEAKHEESSHVASKVAKKSESKKAEEKKEE